MKTRFAVALGSVALAVAVTLAGCSSTSTVAPVTKVAGTLQGQSVLLPTNTVLNIDTGSLAVDSYTATVSDTSIVEFTQGVAGDTKTLPSFKPLKIGTATVTLTNSDTTVPVLKFNILVVGAQ